MQAQRVEQIRQKTQGVTTPTLVRQSPTSERLYTAPDGWMYCTTTPDIQGNLAWKEAKTLVVSKAPPGEDPAAPEHSEQRSTHKHIAGTLPVSWTPTSGPG